MAALLEFVEKAVLTDEGIRVALKIPAARPRPAPLGAPYPGFVRLKVKRRGVEVRLIINGGDEPEEGRSSPAEGIRAGARMVSKNGDGPRPVR